MPKPETDKLDSAAKDSPRSIGRVLSILEALAVYRDGASLTELSLHVHTPKSSLLALLKGMQISGHVTIIAKRYHLGGAAFDLALRLLSARPSISVVREAMRELWLLSQETVVLATIDRNMKIVTYVDAIESPATVRYTVRLGTSRPLYCTAAGQAVLAFQNTAYRERYMETTPLVALTADTITDPVAMVAKLDEVCAQGFAVSRAEAIPNSIGIAAPLFDARSEVSHALLIAGPTDRLDRRVNELSPLLLDVTRRASEMLKHGA